MKFNFIVLVALASYFSCPGPKQKDVTEQDANLQSERVITEKDNKKYKLRFLFRGRDIQVGERNVAVIEKLTLRDDVSGKELGYIPLDEPSLTTSSGYFTDVWSPDEEFLILPRGRFQGFCIVPSSRAWDSLSQKKCDDFVRVQTIDGPQLWHEFIGWTGETTFEFDAGLSGTKFRFEYSIVTQKITSGEKGEFQFENSRGLTRIH